MTEMTEKYILEATYRENKGEKETEAGVLESLP